jgi:ribose 5-phosphate isomerase B
MRISVAADERTEVAEPLVEELRRRGHESRADRAIVAWWTGTGCSIAANKVPWIRAALAFEAETA